ncbi:MAG: hypothetical protein IPP77_00455 [Bacteroidetes bacterium]|nr:hypothetical protein [Bacteroidota bacterium]
MEVLIMEVSDFPIAKDLSYRCRVMQYSKRACVIDSNIKYRFDDETYLARLPLSKVTQKGRGHRHLVAHSSLKRFSKTRTASAFASAAWQVVSAEKANPPSPGRWHIDFHILNFNFYE